MDKKQLEEELDKRLTAKGLIRYAWDYLKAFEDLYQKYPKTEDLYEVKYYLLCHAIELALKAYLREKTEITRLDLMKIGHDLEKLVKLLHENGVVMDIDSMLRTFTANEYYKTKQFEYPQTGYKELPSLDKMRDSARLLLSMVRNKIHKDFP